jgi:arabinofuranosyltransferase
MGRTGIGLPLGLLAIVSLQTMWRWATSGLESGASFLWLGGCFWALARLAEGSGPSREDGRARRLRLTPTLTAVLIGLGPLVRPDLGVFSIGFMIALLVGAPRPHRLARLRLVGWALLLPLAYEVFRMGYFAARVPSTALAKEASSADWSRGSQAVRRALPAVHPSGAVARLRGPRFTRGRAAVADGDRNDARRGDRRRAARRLHRPSGRRLPTRTHTAVQPVRPPSTGDGRDPAPALVARRPRSGCDPVGLRLRLHLRAEKDRVGSASGPITLHDSRDALRARYGSTLHGLAEHGRALVLRVPLYGPPIEVNGAPRASSPAPVVAGALAVGMLGHVAGPRAHIVDQYGITDPLGSRIRLGPLRIPRAGFGLRGEGPYHHAPVRAIAGHEKYLPTEWIIARFAPPGTNRLPRGRTGFRP